MGATLIVGAPVGAGVQYVGAPVVGVEDGRGVGALGAGVGDTVGSGVGMPVGAGLGAAFAVFVEHRYVEKH